MITEIVASDSFQKFLGELEKKMLAGLDEHGKSRHDFRGLAEELKNESLDLAGWGFLAWRKAEKLLANIEEFELKNEKK